MLVPFVGVILLFAIYPQIELSRAQTSVDGLDQRPRRERRRSATTRGEPMTDERRRTSPMPRTHHLRGPHIDYAAISPFEALLGGP